MARRPRAVEEQERRAEELMGEARGGVNADGVVELTSAARRPQRHEIPGDDDDEPQGAAVDDGDGADGGDGGEPAAPPPERRPQPDVWEQRYNTLKGKYDREVPELTRKLNDTHARLEALESRAQQGQGSGQGSGRASPPDQIEQIDDATLEEAREVYGDEFVKIVERLADRAAERRFGKVQPEVQQLKDQLKQNEAQTAQQRVFSALDDPRKGVENWRAINKDKDFLAWLQDPDPYSGVRRGALLSDAFERGATDRVIAVFRGFVAETQATQPPPNGAGTRNGGAGQSRLAAAAAPPVGTRNGAQRPPEARPPIQVKRSEIAAFYDDVRKGLYRSDPEGLERMERRIARAAAEGRVTPK